MQHRTFQANGEPNPLSKRERSAKTLTIENEKLVANPEEIWTPRSVLSILDGLSAVRWANILIQLGTERSIHTFYDWLVRLARSRPQKTGQFGQFYTTTSWKLALEMRSGKTFEEVSAALMKDYDSFSECMSREPLHTTKPKSSTSRTSDAKGGGKLHSKSKSYRFQPYRPAWKNPDRQHQRNYGGNSEDKSWARDSNAHEWKQPQK